jgi:Ca2+-transporting ATPase
MGRIAGMLKQAPDEATPLQRQLDRVGKLAQFQDVLVILLLIATLIASSTGSR